MENLRNARRFYDVESWNVGDRVRQRTWDYSISDSGDPRVSKRWGRVIDIRVLHFPDAAPEFPVEQRTILVRWPSGRVTGHEIDLVPA